MSRVYPLDQLRVSKMPADDFEGCAVYFLWYGPVLCYIGQSRYLVTRLHHHARVRDGLYQGKRILFTRASFIEVNEPGLDDVEAAYIDAYRPPFNTMARGNVSSRKYLAVTT